ncbi:MAG TPA: hypothetical protein VGK06_15220 [Methanosarcina sp.]
MIQCNLCHFNGEPIREYRQLEKLISCPQCGQLISRIPLYSQCVPIIPQRQQPLIELEGPEGVPASKLWGWGYE